MWPRLQLVIFLAFCVTYATADFFGEKDQVYDLLEATLASTDDNNFYIDNGLDGFPAFGFRLGSEVKQPYRLYLPDKLPAEFTLVATFKPETLQTSYLFAVLNPFETVVQLGLRISDGPGTNQNISLVYTSSDQHSHSEELAKFTVPKLTKEWSKIVIRVSVTDITLYMNCHKMATQRVTRIPLELVFDTASTLYIAQAGPHIQEKYNAWARLARGTDVAASPLHLVGKSVPTTATPTLPVALASALAAKAQAKGRVGVAVVGLTCRPGEEEKQQHLFREPTAPRPVL